MLTRKPFSLWSLFSTAYLFWLVAQLAEATQQLTQVSNYGITNSLGLGYPTIGRSNDRSNFTVAIEVNSAPYYFYGFMLKGNGGYLFTLNGPETTTGNPQSESPTATKHYYGDPSVAAIINPQTISFTNYDTYEGVSNDVIPVDNHNILQGWSIPTDCTDMYCTAIYTVSSANGDASKDYSREMAFIPYDNPNCNTFLLYGTATPVALDLSCIDSGCYVVRENPSSNNLCLLFVDYPTPQSNFAPSLCFADNYGQPKIALDESNTIFIAALGQNNVALFKLPSNGQSLLFSNVILNINNSTGITRQNVQLDVANGVIAVSWDEKQGSAYSNIVRIVDPNGNALDGNTEYSLLPNTSSGNPQTQIALTANSQLLAAALTSQNRIDSYLLALPHITTTLMPTTQTSTASTRISTNLSASTASAGASPAGASPSASVSATLSTVLNSALVNATSSTSNQNTIGITASKNNSSFFSNTMPANNPTTNQTQYIIVQSNDDLTLILGIAIPACLLTAMCLGFILLYNRNKRQKDETLAQKQLKQDIGSYPDALPAAMGLPDPPKSAATNMNNKKNGYDIVVGRPQHDYDIVSSTRSQNKGVPGYEGVNDPLYSSARMAEGDGYQPAVLFKTTNQLPEKGYVALPIRPNGQAPEGYVNGPLRQNAPAPDGYIGLPINP